MTKASDTKPTRRTVQTMDGDMVVEVGAAYVTMRPKHARKGGPAEVQVPWGAIYLRAMRDRADDVRRERLQRKLTRA